VDAELDQLEVLRHYDDQQEFQTVVDHGGWVHA
jgi:hypothetical protein